MEQQQEQTLEEFRAQWLNELHHTREETLEPLQKLLKSAEQLGDDVEDRDYESSSPLGTHVTKLDVVFEQYDGIIDADDTEDECAQAPIATLSQECFFHIFCMLNDPRDIEALGSTCKALFVISHDARLWRSLAFQRWPQQVASLGNLLVMDECYKQSWRHMLSCKPWLRWDGLYASKVTYMRRGAQEFGFSEPVHQVTYYRYLRVYPEEQQVVWATSFEDPQRQQQQAAAGVGKPLLALIAREAAGKELPGTTVHLGEFNMNHDTLSAVVHPEHAQESTFCMRFKLFKSMSRRTALEWVEYYRRAPDGNMTSMNSCLFSSTPFYFVEAEKLREQSNEK